jgi:nucleoside-diphosphate-sugar epimerase
VPKTVVVTGASGVLGSALLPRLQGFELVCLAHSRRGDQVGARWVQGDLTQPRMGLDGRAFRRLASRADAVVHCAAATDFGADEAVVRALNVGGTDNVLQFAALADAPLYYVSTAFVARAASARDATGPGCYLASKTIAEAHVRSSGLPAAIVRPSVVIGDSLTGSIARFQGLHALAGAFLRNSLPIVPLPDDARIDFLPQDVVAACIADLVRREDAHGEWWLTAGAEAPSVHRVLDRCAEIGQALGLDLTRPRLMESEVVGRLIRPVFIEPLPPQARRRFDQLLDMTALFEGAEPFSSSLADLGRAVSTEQLEDAFVRSMWYWAEVKGMVDPVRIAA